jgi:hypothetical protein
VMGLGVQQERAVAVEGGMDPVQKRLMFEDEWVAAATFFVFNENNSFVSFSLFWIGFVVVVVVVFFCIEN